MPSRYAIAFKVFALVLLFQSVRSLDKKRSDCLVLPANSSDSSSSFLTFPAPFILHPEDRNKFDVNVTTVNVTAPQNLRIARYPQQKKFVLSWTWKANNRSDDYFGLRLFQNRSLICQRLIRSVKRQGLQAATYKANFYGMEPSRYRIKIRAMTSEASSRMKIIAFRLETGEKLAEDQRRKSDEVAAASYTPDTIDQPLDVLFMVDRSSPLDADLIGSKCLLRNLTDHFQVAYYKKIRIALMNVDGDPGLEFNFRKYHDQYGYQRGYEVLVGEDGVENYVGRALTYASRTLLMPISNLAARQNVPKVIVAILGSESRDAVQAGAQEMLGEPYRVTVAVGYGNASVTDLQEITGGDVESVLFAQNAQEMCQMWTQVHRVIVDRLNDLYSAPLNAPGGFTIGLYNQDVAEIGWQRPDNLVTSYSIRYGPSQMGNNTPTIEMVVDVGQERGVHLHSLDTTTYNVEVVANGINQTSPPSRLVFDMSCAHMVMDAVIMFDTSRWTQNDLDMVRRRFLPSFIGGFLIGIRATRIGIAFYSQEVNYVAPLTTYETRAALMERIPQITYENGNRRTGVALNWAYLYGFEYARRNLPKVLVLVTDGKSEDDVTRGSQNLRSDQTIVIHIGVGRNTSEVEAQKYISRPYIDHYMEVDSYENLTSVQFNLSRTICNKVFDQYKQSNTALSPPIDLQVDNVRNVSFEVTWDTQTESSLIMRYVISDNTTGKNYSVGKNCRQFTFTDLSPGLGYNVSIRSKGLGADSAAEYVSTTTDVLPPYNPSAVQLSSRLLQIRWSSPSDEVVGHEIKIMIQDSLQVIQTITTGKPTRLINTNVISPGIEYKIEIRAIYAYQVISDAAVARVVTDLPIPEDFRVEHVEEWEVKVAWKKLEIPQHKNSRYADTRWTKISYLVKVFNQKEEQVAHESYQPGDDNKLYQGKTENGDLFMLVRNLLPGQQYNATLQAQLHEQLSKPLHTEFMTKRISIPLDVVIMFEISPTLHADDITMTKNFLMSLVNAFETSRDDSVRISATQLSNRPTEIFSMKQSSVTNRNWVEKLKKLSPKAGTSILGTEHFSRVVSEKFKNARSGAARALILLMTNQHYSNLMPETEDELARKGITTIIIQMSHLTQEPYVNQSMMHRYCLDDFDKLYRSVNYVVTDIVRADEYPLARVSRERNLQPRKLTIKRNSQRQLFAHWQSPAEMPDYYLLRLKTAKASVWKRNVTSSRQSSNEYNLESDNPLRKDIKYTLVVEAVASDGFSSRSIITFRSNVTTSSRPNPGGRPNSVSLPGGGSARQCCAARRSQRQYTQRVFSRLREIAKSSPSCLLSGSNVVFLVDSSDSTQPAQFNLLKTWMKRFVFQLKIEQQNRAAIERRKLAIKRRIAKRLPQILSYGVGISIVQFSQTQQVELELKNRITNVFINKYITKMEPIGGSESNLGQALRFVDEKILGNVTTTKKLIHNINYVIIVSSSPSPSSDHFLQTAVALRKAGVKLISIGISNNLPELPELPELPGATTNPASALYNYQLENFNSLEEIHLYENVCRITRHLTPGIFENEEEPCKQCRVTPSPRPTIPQRPRKPSIGRPDEKRPQQPVRVRGARGLKGETGRAGPPGKACFVGAQSLLDLVRSEKNTSTSNNDTQRCGPGFSTPNAFRDALKGDKGDIGAAGPQGPKGMTGRMGLKGISGDVGQIGPQGPRGRPGPKGDPGINRNEMETIARSICGEMMQEQERRFRELLSSKKTTTENRDENDQLSSVTSITTTTTTEAEAYTSMQDNIPQDTTTSSSTSTHLQFDTTTAPISCANGICSTNSDDEDILEDSTSTSGEDKPEWFE